MKKVLIIILILGAAGFTYYLIAGNKGEDIPFEEGIIEDTGIDPNQVKESLKETGKRTVYGSCNAIANGSTCIDYIGSMWQENDMARLNCSDAGVFSENACPYSKFGGCQMNGGSVMEIITWAYEEGPGGYNNESVPYARMSCDSLPEAQWITPEELLQ